MEVPEILCHILEFIDPSLRAFAMLTCSLWNHIIRFERRGGGRGRGRGEVEVEAEGEGRRGRKEEDKDIRDHGSCVMPSSPQEPLSFNSQHQY